MRWEGHPTCYRRTAHQGTVLLESGRPVEEAEVYLGSQQRRAALVVDGHFMLCADVPHAQVDSIVAR